MVKKVKILKFFVAVPSVMLLFLGSLVQGQPSGAGAQRVGSIRYNASKFNQPGSLPVKDMRANRINSRMSTLQTPKDRSNAKKALSKKGVSSAQLKQAAARRAQFVRFQNLVSRFVQVRRQPGQAANVAQTLLSIYHSFAGGYQQLAQRYLAKSHLSLPILRAAAQAPTKPQVPVKPVQPTSPQEIRKIAQQEAAQVKKEVSQVQAQIHQVQGKISQLLSQPTTAVTLDQVRSVVDQAVRNIEKKLADLEARMATQPEVQDPIVDKAQEKIESDAIQFADIEKLTDLIKRAAAILVQPAKYTSSAEHGNAYGQAVLTRFALNDALDDYKETAQPSKAIVNAAEEYIEKLSDLIDKLATPKDVTLPYDEAVDAIQRANELSEAIETGKIKPGKDAVKAADEVVEDLSRALVLYQGETQKPQKPTIPGQPTVTEVVTDNLRRFIENGLQILPAKLQEIARKIAVKGATQKEQQDALRALQVALVPYKESPFVQLEAAYILSKTLPQTSVEAMPLVKALQDAVELSQKLLSTGAPLYYIEAARNDIASALSKIDAAVASGQASIDSDLIADARQQLNRLNEFLVSGTSKARPSEKPPVKTKPEITSPAVNKLQESISLADKLLSTATTPIRYLESARDQLDAAINQAAGEQNIAFILAYAYERLGLLNAQIESRTTTPLIPLRPVKPTQTGATQSPIGLLTQSVISLTNLAAGLPATTPRHYVNDIRDQLTLALRDLQETKPTPPEIIDEAVITKAQDALNYLKQLRATPPARPAGSQVVTRADLTPLITAVTDLTSLAEKVPASTPKYYMSDIKDQLASALTNLQGATPTPPEIINEAVVTKAQDAINRLDALINQASTTPLIRLRPLKPAQTGTTQSAEDVLTGLIGQADTLLAQSTEYRSSAEFGNAYRQAALKRSALNDALNNYRGTMQPSRAIINEAQERINRLSKFIDRLGTPTSRPTA